MSGGNYLINAGIYLINILFSLYILAVMLRVVPEEPPDPDKLVSIPILGGLHHKYRVTS